MEAMAREAWTDERLDDLKEQMVAGFARVDAGFQRVDSEIRDLRRMMFQGFLALTTVVVTCFVGLASLIVF
jgi:hypothetical protein